MKNKKVKIIIAVLAVITLTIGAMYATDHWRMKNGKTVIFSTWGKKYEAPLSIKGENEGVNVALTLDDKISKNTVWCGTFQLIWNDLKNDLAKQNITFNPQLEVVENLNKETFTTNDLSEQHYYKKVGRPSIELKQQIENAIKEKFNETSEILDEFNWENRDPKDFFLYVMLKKQFDFEKAFQELENGNFGSYSNVEYFGIDKNDFKEELRKQVEVLYYNTKYDFAIKLKTKQGDEVILCKNPKQATFNEIYQNILQEENGYKMSNKLTMMVEGELLKVPNIQLNTKKEFTEIQEKPFYFSNGDEYTIEKAIQTIEFELNKAGGKIKSEAGIMAKNEALIIYDEIREFVLDDTFAMFLKEEGKGTPYFAARIDDISKFQPKNKEIKNNAQKEDKVVEMYEAVIDDLMSKDTGLNYGAKYISLDIDSFKSPNTEGSEYLNLSDNQKQQLLEYCKKYNEDVKDCSYNELKEQGLVTERFPSIEGLLIYVSEIEKLTEKKAVLSGIKYKSGLGAIFIDYELNYKNGIWNLKRVRMAIS